MRSLLLLAMILSLESFATDENGKIDMHGGKDAPLFETKKDFQAKAFGFSALRDINASKKSEPTKK